MMATSNKQIGNLILEPITGSSSSLASATTTITTITMSRPCTSRSMMIDGGDAARQHHSTPIRNILAENHDNQNDDADDDEFHDLIPLENISYESSLLRLSPTNQSQQLEILQDTISSPPSNLFHNNQLSSNNFNHGSEDLLSLKDVDDSIEKNFRDIGQKLEFWSMSPMSLVTDDNSQKSFNMSDIMVKQQDDDYHNNNHLEKISLPEKSVISNATDNVSKIDFNQSKNISAISFSINRDDSSSSSSASSASRIIKNDDDDSERNTVSAGATASSSSAIQMTIISKNHSSQLSQINSTIDDVEETKSEILPVGNSSALSSTTNNNNCTFGITKNHSSPQLIKPDESSPPSLAAGIKVGATNSPKPEAPITISSAGSSPKIAKKRRSNNFFQNIISPHYRVKAAEFNRLFAKDIPKDELLIAEFHCALNGCQGRIYISRNHFCFYCNIMGVYARNLTFNFGDVVAITKANSALVIPNALQIMIKSSSSAGTATAVTTTNSSSNIEQIQRYLFTQFTQRDKTFALMESVWKRSDKPLTNGEIQDLVHKFYGEDLGFMNDNEEMEFFAVPNGTVDDGDPEMIIPTTAAVVATEDLLSSMAAATTATATTNVTTVPPPSTPKIIGDDENPLISSADVDSNISSLTGGVTETITSNDGVSSTSTLPLTSSNRFFASASISQVEGSCRCTDHKESLVLDQIFPFPVDYLFELLFIDENFSRFLHKKRHTTGVKINPWMPFDERHRPQIPIPDGDYDITTSEFRTLKYTLKVNGVPLVKSSLVYETQYILQSDSNRAYCLLSQVQNNNIPYSDCFLVATRWCLTSCLPSSTSEDDDNSLLPFHTRLMVHVDVHFIKNSFSLSLIKSSIEKNSVQGVRDYLTDIAGLLRSNRFNDPLLDPVGNQETARPLLDNDGHTGEPLGDQGEDDSSGSSSSTDSDEPGTDVFTKRKSSNRFFAPLYLAYGFGRNFVDIALQWPVTESQLLKIVFVMLLAVIIINVNLLRQIYDVESRLGMMIDMIEARRSAADTLDNSLNS